MSGGRSLRSVSGGRNLAGCGAPAEAGGSQDWLPHEQFRISGLSRRRGTLRARLHRARGPKRGPACSLPTASAVPYASLITFSIFGKFNRSTVSTGS